MYFMNVPSNLISESVLPVRWAEFVTNQVSRYIHKLHSTVDANLPSTLMKHLQSAWYIAQPYNFYKCRMSCLQI